MVYPLLSSRVGLRLGWVGLGWVGLGWVGLGWVGLATGTSIHQRLFLARAAVAFNVHREG